MYRSSTGDLSFHEDPPVRERWDRDRFERMRGGRGRDEHDHFRFQEHERYPGVHRDIDIHEDIDRRGGRSNVIEKERFREEDRFDRPSRRRTELFEESTPSEVANRALAPYRRKSVVEKDIDISIRRPARPQYIRRQSSLDTFDRRPRPRYEEYEYEREREHERDEWRPPTNVPIPLPIRERRRSPPRYREEDFEEVRYRDIEREPRHEEYREVEIKREKSRHRKSRSKASRSVAASSHRSSSSSSFEEVEPPKNLVGRKGKTRLPKRLVKKQAVIELGYPYEEEEDFIIVKRALEKDHIDEIIKISENYKEVERTTYVYEDKTVIEEAAPPPPPPPPAFFPPPEFPPPPPSVHSHHPPPPQSVHSHHPPPPSSVHSHHHKAPTIRTLSPPRHEIYEERIEESNHIGGPLTVLVPEDRYMSRSERDIKEEIRALETERRLLKYEREGDYEIIERRDPREKIVRIEKDRKGRLALVRSQH
ncbi:hypothetical protein EJ04DRAFT_544215 [Polyplosphaeria fusca]|uniref:DUF8035 domain-containing protein n=1 Tax=Polyplosphaeria fusca TaxID=682080 RepID=A0A9P4QY43_9PLEO|nr:hypothetical protein EJ04DRAFT_544215 [Polyplosphaeria fusca]